MGDGRNTLICLIPMESMYVALANKEEKRKKKEKRKKYLYDLIHVESMYETLPKSNTIVRTSSLSFLFSSVLPLLLLTKKKENQEKRKKKEIPSRI
jgi:hypothetical protein